MYEKIKPKFVKRYLSLSDEITNAVESYRKDIEEGKFPLKENWFPMEKAEYEKLRKEIES
jgi:3-methyl-2-oxobutanoate hydroxymethyltransferase